MKKITFLMAMLFATVGFSQDLLLGFESGESGGINGGPFGGGSYTVEAGTGTNTTQVVKVVADANGEVWQGSNFNLTENVDLTSTNTMTIDVKSSTAITFLVKVNGGVNGAVETAAAVTHNGDGTWQTLTFTFDTSLDGKAAAPNGVYAAFVIHAYWASGATEFGTVSKDSRTFYVDNIKGPKAAAVTTPEPTDLPADPTRDANDVLSFYGDTYSSAVTMSNVGWDDSDFETFTVNGKEVLKISGANFLGVDLGTYLDASNMTHLHMDYWIAQDWQAGQVLNPKLSNHAAQAGETNAFDISNPINDQTEVKNWQSKDFELGSGDKASIKEFLITQAGKATVFYLDNVYLYNANGGGGGGGNTSGAPSTAAPDAPTFNNASDVAYVWSGTNEATGLVFTPFAGASESTVQIAGNDTKKLEIPTAGGGMNFAFAAQDFAAAGITHIYFNYYTEAVGTGKVINVNIQGGGANWIHTIALPASKSANAQWNTVDLAISGLNDGGDGSTNAISQVQFTGAGPSNPIGDVYIDNVLFYKSGTASVDTNNLFNVSVYPNPANNLVNLSANENITKVDVFNVIGKKMRSFNVNSNSTSINISDLNPGIYLIKYEINNKVGTTKFIKN